MTTTAPEPAAGLVTVQLRHKETGALGTSPVAAVDHWLGLGYEVVDDNERKEAEAAPFDPAASSAKATAEYLKGLDTATPEGQAEHDRVVAAEKAAHNDGAGRPTALN